MIVDVKHLTNLQVCIFLNQTQIRLTHISTPRSNLLSMARSLSLKARVMTLFFSKIFALHSPAHDRRVARRCSERKGVLRNFANFTGKHLWKSLFFNKIADLQGLTLIKLPNFRPTLNAEKDNICVCRLMSYRLQSYIFI